MQAAADAPLSAHCTAQHGAPSLRLGVKLLLTGASLTSQGPCAPLDPAAYSARLQLHANGVCRYASCIMQCRGCLFYNDKSCTPFFFRAPPGTTLGFSRHHVAYSPADRVLRDGGAVGVTVLCIQRVHPVQWFESTSKGPVCRSGKAQEEHRRRQHEAMQQV